MQYTKKQNCINLPQKILLTTLLNLNTFLKSHLSYRQDSTVYIMLLINKPKTHCFGIDQSFFHSSSIYLGLQEWTWA